jgi:flagellar motor switch protein FliM
VSIDVEPEEQEALRELLDEPGAKAPEVVERDFRAPRRLSATRIAAIRQALEESLPEFSGLLEGQIGAAYGVTIDGIEELDALALQDEVEEHPAMIRLTSEGRSGWVVWENAAALRTIEDVLGESSDAAETRALSAGEARVMLAILGTLGQAVCAALQHPIEAIEPVSARDATGLQDAADDPHRLVVELGLAGPGAPSQVRVVLPGFREPTADEQAGEPAAAAPPDHLELVDVDIHVELGPLEIEVEDLLGLEEGDVLPLDTGPTDSVMVSAGTEGFALAKLGRKGDTLAVRIVKTLHSFRADSDE